MDETKVHGVKVTLAKYDVYPATYYYWKKQYQADGADSLVDHAVGLLSVVPYEQLTPNIVLVPLSSSAANGDIQKRGELSPGSILLVGYAI